jgi:hypothetical protein
MLTIDQTGLTADLAADGRDAKAGCVTLVPLAPAPLRGSAGSRTSRPDPSFVTHLIATAEQAPQTRRLRRAAPQEALSAYAAHLIPAAPAGGQTRRTV